MLLAVQSVGPKVALADPLRAPRRGRCSPRWPRGDVATLQAAPGRRQAHRGADRCRAAREGRHACSTPRRSSCAAATTRSAWPARRCSASATRPPRSTRCSPAPRRERRGAHRARAAERAAMSPCRARRIQARGGDSRRRRRARPLAAAPAAGGIRRPAGAQGSARRLDRRCRQPRRGAGPRAAGRPARAWARPRWPRSSPPSSGCSFVQTAGPALERKGDVASFLTALEPRVGVLRRRDPPPAPGAGGDLLPGDGGRAAADHRRPGRRRPRGDAAAAAVHADRRDHPDRPADHAAARPLRDPAPARALRAPRIWRGSCCAPRGCSGSRSSPTGRDAIAARSRGTPRVANRLLKRVRDYAEVRHGGVDHRRGRRARRSTCSRSTTRAWTGWTARSCGRSASGSAAARSACRRWRSRSARSRTRSRTSMSPTCCSAA